MLIQVLAGALLLLGSGLILHALVALDAPEAPRQLKQPRFGPLEEPHEEPSVTRLRKAA